MARYLTKGGTDDPKLSVYMNLDNLVDLKTDSKCWSLEGEALTRQLIADGFEGVQVTHGNALSFETMIPYCGLDRINTPGEAEPVFARHAARGDSAITLHVGWGLEDDTEVDRLVESVLLASDKYNLPAFIETHRATVTQDMWRTVQITKRFPEVRFNGDFSHYYCGQEMVYGDIDEKLDFMQPVFDRIGFLHGRIASPGNMQVPIENIADRPMHSVGKVDYLADFKKLWIRAMSGFKKNACSGAILIFTPELLTSGNFYARLIMGENGELEEENDRYAQALLYKDLAHHCFNGTLDD